MDWLLMKRVFQHYLALPQPILGHSRVDSFTNPNLITVFGINRIILQKN